MSTEVRKCQRCREAAAVAVEDWGQRSMGFDTGRVSKREYRCQACGAGFAIESMYGLKAVTGLLVGVPLLMGALTLGGVSLTALGQEPALAIGLLVLSALVGFVGVAAAVGFTSSYRAHMANPVVPGAPVPEVVHTATEPPRHCSCGTYAPVTKVVARRINYIPSGTDYTHQCPSCGKEFEISSPWGLITGFLSVAILAPVVAIFAVPLVQGDFAWANILCGGVGGLVVLLAMSGAVLGAYQRWFVHTL